MAISEQKNIISVVLLIFVMCYEVISEKSCDIDVEETLKALLNPQENNSMQVRALRLELFKRLQKLSEKLEQEEADTNKKSFMSLAKWNDIPEHKRNLEALARAGYIKTLPDEEDADANYKRSIANLAKNGQLPMRKDEQKRGIESLARNGGFQMNKELLGPYSLKRSLSSLAKSGDLGPNRQLTQKKNIGTLVRDGMIPGKRYTQNYYDDPKYLEDRREYQFKRSSPESDMMGNRGELDNFFDNRGIPSVDNQNYPDYDLVQELNSVRTPYNFEKRFLGSVAKSGWFRPFSSPSKYPEYFRAEKRHIGSLARLGWLPSFRQIRRFNRSGRSTTADDSCRTITTDGKTKTNPDPELPSIPLMEGRQPVKNMFFLRKVFYHPRSH